MDESYKDVCQFEGCNNYVMLWGPVTGFIPWCREHKHMYEEPTELLVSVILRANEKPDHHKAPS